MGLRTTLDHNQLVLFEATRKDRRRFAVGALLIGLAAIAVVMVSYFGWVGR